MDPIVQMLTGPINRVSAVYRFSAMHVIKRESVAEHSFMVALYSHIINEHLGRPAIRGQLFLRAIAHDLEESLTGDFVRSFKYSDPELQDRIEAASRRFITELVGADLDLLHAWEQAKDDTIEGHIIRVADYASVVSYVIRELQMGNSLMVPVAVECRDYGQSVLTSTVSSLRPIVMTVMATLQKVRGSYETNAVDKNGGDRPYAGCDLASE